jgi:hypothetical protein
VTRGCLASLFLAGCTFGVSGLPLTGPDQDLGTTGDLASGGSEPDLSMPASIPSHTDPSTLDPTTGDLSGVTAIDTTQLKLTPPAANVKFIHDAQGHAVLSVGAWNVDKNVQITGGPSLIVVATGAVIVDAVIDASADHEAQGAGGGAPAMGSGFGAGGSLTATHTLADDDDTGGAGAGFATPGGKGGDTPSGTGPPGGAVYGGVFTVFEGGSGGGAGGEASSCQAPFGSGGGGGGAIQISSAAGITVTNRGEIHVNGGGGRGGCGTVTSAGGGGGSGGVIFLEAPAITVNGNLFANGGGGGAGGDGSLTSQSSGKDGENGHNDTNAAKGGDNGDGFGGGGGGLSVTPTGGLSGTNGGGGGGAAGRIWLRAHMSATVAGAAKISPAFTPDLLP